jgi:hypothetical protein
LFCACKIPKKNTLAKPIFTNARESINQNQKQKYLGGERERKKPVKASEKMRFKFDWDAHEDTSRDLNPLYNTLHGADAFARRPACVLFATVCRAVFWVCGKNETITKDPPTFSLCPRRLAYHNRGGAAVWPRHARGHRPARAEEAGLSWGGVVGESQLCFVQERNSLLVPPRFLHKTNLQQPKPKKNQNQTKTSNQKAAAVEAQALAKLRAAAGIEETGGMRAALAARAAAADKYDGFDMNVRFLFLL